MNLDYYQDRFSPRLQRKYVHIFCIAGSPEEFPSPLMADLRPGVATSSFKAINSDFLKGILCCWNRCLSPLTTSLLIEDLERYFSFILTDSTASKSNQLPWALKAPFKYGAASIACNSMPIDRTIAFGQVKEYRCLLQARPESSELGY